jgi:hypothetical protein
MDIETLVGVFGASLILVAFTLNQVGVWSKDSFSYDVVNACGSLALILYSYMLSSYPFLVLNGVWFLVSVRDLVHTKAK